MFLIMRTSPLSTPLGLNHGNLGWNEEREEQK